MRLTGIETIIPGDGSPLPEIVFVRVHTDQGIVGHGETYYTPRAVAAYIHEFLAPKILTLGSASPEAVWELGYRTASRFGGRGLELRALSAIDVALWDALAVSVGLPLHVVLGGPSVDRVPVYNTCAGPSYGKSWKIGGGATGAGRFEDYDAFLQRPGELARELVAEGFAGMKIWPFDRFAHRAGAQHIAPEDLRAGLEPFEKIREAVGSQIEIMAEGHGLWSLPAAKKIARALEPFQPAWIEDLIVADNPDAIAELKRSTTIPLLVSEYLMSRFEYSPIIERGIADQVMIDPTWCGGITESRRIVALADAKRLPVTFHDCTGPFTLLAGVHLGFSSPNASYQEVVRAYLSEVYPQFVDDLPKPGRGAYVPPTRPGLGAVLQTDVVDRPGVEVQLTGKR
ncbi:MAG: mandelate racemase/muconate lactonizing enzyme family protein [Actinobacteria bacterium]|jgi:L-alanine-DL-glutamate epimerase-like enolase superfamily enzyme|nr:mandelate racemase/muconate lactonizing enzyme family protein [Actinomycetota bacterium]